MLMPKVENSYLSLVSGEINRYHPYDKPTSYEHLFPTPSASPSPDELSLHHSQDYHAFTTMEKVESLYLSTLAPPDSPDSPDGPDGPDSPPPPPPPPKVTITYLKKHLNSLTHEAKKGAYDEYIGHEDSMRCMLHAIFNRKSIMISGNVGYGKRTLVRMLAARLANGPAIPGVQNQYIMELDVRRLRLESGWIDKFKQRIEEVCQLKSKVILSLPHLQTLNADAQGLQALGFLKEKMESGLRVVATADTHIEKPKWMQDMEHKMRFIKLQNHERKKITLLLLAKERAELRLTVFNELFDHYAKVAKKYHLTLDDDAVETAMERAEDFYPNSDLDGDELFEGAALWIERALAELVLRLQESPSTEESAHLVNRLLILEVYSLWTGEDLDSLLATSSGLTLKNPLGLEHRLKQQVIGQDSAVHCVAAAVLTMVSGLKDETAPIGSFLFLGSTGVGKTELAKALAREMFGSENSLIRIDMSEYQEKHTVSRLIGAPPGYVGYDKGGQLTEAVRKNPYAVVLLDEIEKAHPDVLKVFLQVFDDGRLTDGKGKTVDFRNCLFILTSNLKAAEIGKFSSQGKTSEEILTYLQGFLMKTLSPELYNRLDAVIPFNYISKEILNAVVPMMLKKLGADIKEKIGNTLYWTPDVLDYLGKHGYSQELGLRPLKRLVTKHTRNLISKGVLSKEFARGDDLLLYVEEGSLKVKKIPKETS